MNYCDPSRFEGDLVIRVIPHWELPQEGSSQLYEVMQPFAYLSEYGRVQVQRGFITDFGSVPSMAKWLVDNDDPDIVYGALPHDQLYRTKGQLNGVQLTRRDADIILYHAMLHAGAPMFKAKLVFQCVRVGGSGSWRER